MCHTLRKSFTRTPLGSENKVLLAMWSRLAPNEWSQAILWLCLPSSWRLQVDYHAQTLHLINNLLMGTYLPGIVTKICTDGETDPSDLLFIYFSFF